MLLDSEDTGGHSCTMELTISPNRSYPPQTHDVADEFLYVLDGEATMSLGESTFRAAPGDVVFIPRGVAHAFITGASAAKLLVIFSPGGFERLIREQGEPLQD